MPFILDCPPVLVLASNQPEATIRVLEAIRIARHGFYIPSGIALTDEQIARVAAAVKRALS